MVVRGGSERGVVGTADVSVSGSTVALDVERDLLGDPDEDRNPGRSRARIRLGERSGRPRGRGPDSGPHAYMLGDGGRSFWLAGGRGCCGDARRPRARPGSAFWAAASQQGAPLRGIGCSSALPRRGSWFESHHPLLKAPLRRVFYDRSPSDSGAARDRSRARRFPGGRRESRASRAIPRDRAASPVARRDSRILRKVGVGSVGVCWVLRHAYSHTPDARGSDVLVEAAAR